jgi:hypothetical protein
MAAILDSEVSQDLGREDNEEKEDNVSVKINTRNLMTVSPNLDMIAEAASFENKSSTCNFYGPTRSSYDSHPSGTSAFEVRKTKNTNSLNKYNFPIKSEEEEEDFTINNMLEAKLQKFWEECKADCENQAEKKSKALLRLWEREGVTLAEAIESTLKEYSEIYEKAHAIRELFEQEKQKWKEQVMTMVLNNCRESLSNPYESNEI